MLLTSIHTHCLYDRILAQLSKILRFLDMKAMQTVLLLQDKHLEDPQALQIFTTFVLNWSSFVLQFQIVKMLVVLILIFGVCWLPYHAYFIYSYHYPSVRRMNNIQHIFLAFYWFAMTHSMVNPIVYYHMNPT